MAATLTGTLQILTSSTLSDTVGVATSQSRVLDAELKLFTTGTLANQANAQYTKSGTIAASATPEDLNLSNLYDVFGMASAFTKVRQILVRNTHATATISIGGAVANAFALFANSSDILQIAPGGVFVYADFAAGKTVTASTGDILRIASSANGGTYELIILGTK